MDTPRYAEEPVEKLARAATLAALNAASVTPRSDASSSAVSGPRLRPDASPVARKYPLCAQQQCRWCRA